jgi:hypothetical protein
MPRSSSLTTRLTGLSELCPQDHACAPGAHTAAHASRGSQSIRSGRVANLAVTARHGSPETTRILETTRAMASEGPSEGGRDGRVRV